MVKKGRKKCKEKIYVEANVKDKEKDMQRKKVRGV